MNPSRVLLPCLAAAALFAASSVKADGSNGYSVTIGGTCTTDFAAVYRGIDGVAIQIGSDTFHIAIAPLNQFISEAGYFWWLSDVHQPLPPPPEVPADSPLINASSIKVYVAHGICGGSANTTGEVTTTTISAPAPPSITKAYFCINKYSKRPLAATLNIVARRLTDGAVFAPYWTAGRVAGGVNAGKGRLACAVPRRMARDGVFRDGRGMVLARKPGLARQPGVYPELKKKKR